MVYTSVAVACLLSLAVAAPAELDGRTLAVERAIGEGPVIESRSLANLLYPNKYTNGPIAQLSEDQENEWTTLAHYTAAVYCKPEDVKAWDCGLHCSSVRRPEVVLFGGDNAATPYYYVANDGDTVYISIAGTNTKNALSLANDINFFPRRVSTSYFPDSKGVEVHAGFYGAFTRLAGPIATAVNSQVANGTTQVVVLGHSLGAAVGELTATYLAYLLGPSVTVQGRFIASPRVGNVPWARYVDKTFGDRFSYLINYNDPVAHLPPKDFGFRHPSNEVYIPAIGSPDMFACAGSENKKCSDQFADPFEFITSIKDWMTSEVHNGPYGGVLMGNGQCKQ